MDHAAEYRRHRYLEPRGLNLILLDHSFTVKYLGFFDYQGDGLTETHDVGIYDPAGNLLASATVLPGDPLIGHFRWVAVSPIVLDPGR